MKSKNASSSVQTTGRETYKQMMRLISRESNRGLVLTSAAFLDNRLRELLSTRFNMQGRPSKTVIRSLLDGLGPLSSFSSKIKLCYALGFIAKWVYQDLEIIRKLRNQLAHDVGVARFDAPETTVLTQKLKGADYAVQAMAKQPKAKEKPFSPSKKRNQSTAWPVAKMERMRLSMTVSYLGGHLVGQLEVLSTTESLLSTTPAMVDSINAKDDRRSARRRRPRSKRRAAPDDSPATRSES